MLPYPSQNITAVCSKHLHPPTRLNSIIANKATIWVKKPSHGKNKLTEDTSMQSNYVLPVFH
jgi:hypothetical protein